MRNYDLDNIYTYHAPVGNQQQHYEYLRLFARGLAQEILDRVPESRERSVALTNLETALFWANAGIARNKPQSDDAEVV